LFETRLTRSVPEIKYNVNCFMLGRWRGTKNSILQSHILC